MQTLSNFRKTNPTLIYFGATDIGPYYWVGLCKNGIDYYVGQTFKAPANGLLSRIKLFPSIVFGATTATLSVYEFDQQNYSWKSKCAEASQFIPKGMEGNWINFDLKGLMVNKNYNYAFKLSAKSGGMLAIAECPWNIINPYADGEEWIGSSQQEEGNFHKDFDLAFEGEIEP